MLALYLIFKKNSIVFPWAIRGKVTAQVGVPSRYPGDLGRIAALGWARGLGDSPRCLPVCQSAVGLRSSPDYMTVLCSLAFTAGAV